MCYDYFDDLQGLCAAAAATNGHDAHDSDHDTCFDCVEGTPGLLLSTVRLFYCYERIVLLDAWFQTLERLFDSHIRCVVQVVVNYGCVPTKSVASHEREQHAVSM